MSAQTLELQAIWRDLGQDERRVLIGVARRLQIGRERYGDLRLATDQRDWGREAEEELLDALIYRQIAREGT